MRTLRTVLIVLLTLLLLFALGYRFLWTADNLAALGDLFYKTGNLRFASTLYESAISNAPDNEELSLRLTDVYLAQGNHTKAERALVSAIRVAPTQQLYLRLSQLYVEQDKLFDALHLVEGILDPAMRAQIDALRPSAPQFAPEAGRYDSYISVSASAGDAKVYYSDNVQFPSTARPFEGGIKLSAGKTSVQAIAVSENGLVSPLAEAEYEVVGVVEEVTFSDAAFDSYIRELLYKADSTAIYTNELWEVTELTIPESVTSYDDLRHFTNLQSLTLRKSNGDLSVLSTLTQLQTLDLAGGLLSRETLGAIGSLSNLHTLNLSACGLSNIDALGTLTELETLDLSDNSIRDTGALSSCIKLQSLNLSRNALLSVDGLAALTELTELNLSSNRIESIAPLAACTKMLSLNLSVNQISDLSALSGMTKLTTLNAQSNAVTTVSALSACTDLTVLSLAYNEIEDISALSTMSALTELDISHNRITALPRWSSALPLSRLTASYNQISEISVLSGMKSLMIINLDYNDSLSDVLCLVSCPKLVQLDVFGTAVRNVQALVDLGVVVNYSPV